MSVSNSVQEKQLSWPASNTFGRLPISPEFAPGSAFVNGSVVSLQEATVPLLDWGFLRSDACQETISAWNGQLFRLEDHLDRFERSLGKLRMVSPLSRNELSDVVHRLIATCGFDKAYVQIVMTRGVPPVGSRDLRLCVNRFQAFCFPYVWIATQEQQQRGFNVHVSDRVRVPSMSVDPLVKHYHWLDFQMGLLDAYSHDTDTVVLIDEHDNISEGPGFNIFAVIDGKLVTPQHGVLDGMTRRTVLEIAQERNIEVVVRALTKSELISSSEAFLTSTAGGIMPATSIDGVKLGDGTPGEMTRRIHAAYWQIRTQGPLVSPVNYSLAQL